MQHYHSLEAASLKIPGSPLACSMASIADIVRSSKNSSEMHTRNHAPAVVLTFDPHPAAVLTGKEIRCLTTPDERADLLAALGVDVVITQRFTRDLSTASALEYMTHLKESLGLTHLLIGYDFALGKGREGNAARLTEIGLELNYSVEVVSALSDESGVISSTEIRKLISTGNINEASKLLGYRYQLGGEIIHGEGRGKTINFPTANVNYPKGKVIPPNGIYACWAHLGAQKFMAATNIGLNPTFTPERQIPSLEAYLLDFDRDIYGETMQLEFVTRLRDEIRYKSVDALIKQIHDDVDQTRKILS
jgi:riboflavin kinase/FMN adenylyltransferase